MSTAKKAVVKKSKSSSVADASVMKLKSVSKNRIAGSHKDDIVEAAEDFKKQRRAEKKELREAKEHIENLGIWLAETKEKLIVSHKCDMDNLRRIGLLQSENVKLRTDVTRYRSITESMQGIIDELMEISK